MLSCQLFVNGSISPKPENPLRARSGGEASEASYGIV
jgi:hypothetical protein